MTLQALANVIKSGIYGLGFYQSFRYSCSLAVGWKEQHGLCTIDHIGNLSMLVITGYANMKALRGTTFANRVWRLSYLTYAAVPLLQYMTKQMDAKVHREFDFQQLSEEYKSDGAGDDRPLSQRIQDCWFDNGIPRPYAKKFAKDHAHDERSYEERIEAYVKGLNYNQEHMELRDRYMAFDDKELVELVKSIASDESGGSGRLAGLIKKFPKEGEDDHRPLGDRIESALENHEITEFERKAKAVIDFTYVHISDFVLLASVAHTVAAIRIGFN